MTRTVKLVGYMMILALVGAGCAGDDDDSASANGDENAGAVDEGSDGEGSEGPSCEGDPDEAVDEELGEGAGRMQQVLNCAAEQPLAAEGEPIQLGFFNHEGDPAGSFPEGSAAAEAAVEFINNELGGVGGEVLTGTPGRPLELVTCLATISPTETTSCANELAAEDPFGVVTNLNFFGSAFYDVLAAANVPTYSAGAINLADFTSPNVLTVGPGGGCVGINLGESAFSAYELEAKNIMVVWADTPPGVVCHHDAQKKTLNVISGEHTPTPEGVEVVDDLEHDAVSFAPGTADLTGVATQVLDADPDAVMMTVAASDCWNFISALYAVGYNPDTGPALVFNGSCDDPDRIQDAGEQAEGIYFVGPASFTSLDAYEGLLRQEVALYEDKLNQYVGDDAPRAGNGYSSFTTILTLWDLWTQHAAEAGSVDELTPESAFEYVAQTSNRHAFGSYPMGCADSVEPYLALCNTSVAVSQWTGDGYDVHVTGEDYLYLVAGTEIDPVAAGG